VALMKPGANVIKKSISPFKPRDNQQPPKPPKKGNK
jgi:hypothetical protein